MQEISLWLHLAIEDLESADALYDTHLHDAAVYHSQQCAEKALKAFLWEHDIEPEKIHDVVKLVHACLRIETQLSELLGEAGLLKTYATDYRYPDRYRVLSEVDVAEALNAAEKVLMLILARLDLNYKCQRRP